MFTELDWMLITILCGLLGACAVILAPGNSIRKYTKPLWLAMPDGVLDKLGIDKRKSVKVAAIWKVGSVITLVILFLSSGALGPTAMAIGLICFFLPEFLMLSVYKNRKRAITHSILSLVHRQRFLLETGMSVARCMQRLAGPVGTDHKDPMIAELKILQNQTQNGVTWSHALKGLNSRTGVDSVYEWTMIVQSARDDRALLLDTLKAFSEKLMTQRENDIKQQASRLSVWSMLPMLLISVPMFIVLVFFPAGVKILEVGSLMKDLF